MDDFKNLCHNLGYKQIYSLKNYFKVPSGSFSSSSPKKNLCKNPRVTSENQSSKVTPHKISHLPVFVRTTDDRLDEFLKSKAKVHSPVKFSSPLQNNNADFSYPPAEKNIKNKLPIKNLKKVRKSKSENNINQKYDAILDLHGLKIPEAFEAFISFIRKNFVLNKRSLLVITGLGNPENFHSIKNSLIRWIEGRNDLQKMISCFEHPPVRDGGAGAFLIHLRKFRGFDSEF